MQLIHYPFSAQQQIKSQQKTIISLDCLLLSVHPVKIPKMSANQAKQAVIYALEDELLQSIDELSIFPNKEQDQSWSAIVVENETLSQVKAQIDEKAINCLALVPEFMCLPLLTDKISYIEQGDLVVFRASKFNGGKIDKTIFFELYEQDNLQAAEFGQHYAGFNFLKISIWATYSKQIKQFRVSCALLVFIFILNLASLVIENQQLSKHLAVKKAQNKTLFKSTFPDIKSIVDLPVQLQVRLDKIDKWQKLLNKDLLLAMSKYKFDNNTKSIKFENNELQVLKK